MNNRIALAMALMGLSACALASSHREAPSITKTPKVDATDFYMFKSYESNRGDYVTILANYQPLQDAYGGPNYFALDPKALYEIHIDNNGDAQEDITFQFKFDQELKDLQVPVGGKNISVPLSNIGKITNDGSSAQNTAETYTVTMVKGDRRKGDRNVLGSFKNLLIMWAQNQFPIISLMPIVLCKISTLAAADQAKYLLASAKIHLQSILAKFLTL